MDPDNEKVVPKRHSNNRLNLLFSGDFKDAPEPSVTEDSSDSELDPMEMRSPLSARRTKQSLASPGRNISKMSSASKNAKAKNISPAMSKLDEGRDSMLQEKRRIDKILKGTIGYATDIKRDLHSKGAVTDRGELLADVFRAKLASGEIDMEPYKEALK